MCDVNSEKKNPNRLIHFLPSESNISYLLMKYTDIRQVKKGGGLEAPGGEYVGGRPSVAAKTSTATVQKESRETAHFSGSRRQRIKRRSSEFLWRTPSKHPGN